MPFKYEINGQMVEFDKEPSEADIDEAASQFTQQESQEKPIFTTAKFEPVETAGVSPLNAGQELLLGFAANDKLRLEYLQKELAGKNVALDQEKGLTVDGVRVNPQGLDMGDVTRNAGYSFNLAGQFLGNIFGGAAGVPGGPAGVVAGSVVGGITGSGLGNGLRLAIGDLLGLDPDGKDVTESMIEDAQQAAFGEVLGLGMTGAGRAVKPALSAIGKTKFIKGISNIWGNVAKKTGDMFPQLAQFVGGIEPDATKVAMKYGAKNVLNETYFDPEASIKVVNNVLFGNKNMGIVDTFIQGAGMKKGTIELAKSIKEVGSQYFDDFIREFGGMSDNAIETIKRSTFKDVINPANHADSRPYDIAKTIVKGAKHKEKLLGEEIGKQEMSALKDIGNQNFILSDITPKVDKILKGTALLKSIKVKGYDANLPTEIKGIDELVKLREIFGSTKNIIDDTGKKIKVWNFYDKVKNKDAFIMKQRVNALADSVFQNDRIPSSVKIAFKDIADTFRDKYANKMGLSAKNSQYSMFKNIVDETNIDGNGALRQWENFIKGYGKRGTTDKTIADNLLSELPGGNSLKRAINLYNTGKELSDFDILGLAQNLEKRLTNKTILSQNKTDLMEKVLIGLDNHFKSTPKLSNRAFIEEAEKALAAKAFMGGSPNILRVQTVAAIMGFSGLVGFMKAGPIGAMTGLGLSLTATSPRSIAKALVTLDKKLPQKAVSKFISGAKRPGQKLMNSVEKKFGKYAKKEDILRALLSVASTAQVRKGQ